MLIKSKSSKKISRTIKISKSPDYLSDSYFRESVMNPKQSSSMLKEEIRQFMSSFDDETDMIESDDKIVSIRSV